MNYLLDTHTLIWFMNGDENLPPSVINVIKNKHNNCIVSIASIWEIAIKSSIGKLDMKVNFEEISTFLSTNYLNILPIEFNHLATLLKLEFHHRDPFDRIIIAQAITENMTIITIDKHFRSYPVRYVWQ